MSKISSKKYPIKNSTASKLFYFGVFIVLPALLLCLASIAIGMIVFDVPLGNMNSSLAIALSGTVTLLSVACTVYLFMRLLRYGSYGGYYSTRNAIAFKNSAISLLESLQELFATITPAKTAKAVAEYEECIKALGYCIDKIRSSKKPYLSLPSQSKLETVIFSEIKNARDIFEDEEFSVSKFAVMIKKVRFCVDERYTKTVVGAYRGDGNYVFISYSHRNTKIVLDVIKKLQGAGINVWYDEGITEGDDWMDHLAKKIDKCSHFVMFQSTTYARSHNCNVEIKRALKNTKKIIRLILDDSKLSDGIEMYLDAIQAIDCRENINEKIDRVVQLITSDTDDRPKKTPRKRNA